MAPQPAAATPALAPAPAATTAQAPAQVPPTQAPQPAAAFPAPAPAPVPANMKVLGCQGEEQIRKKFHQSNNLKAHTNKTAL